MVTAPQVTMPIEVNSKACDKYLHNNVTYTANNCLKTNNHIANGNIYKPLSNESRVYVPLNGNSDKKNNCLTCNTPDIGPGLINTQSSAEHSPQCKTSQDKHATCTSNTTTNLDLRQTSKTQLDGLTCAVTGRQIGTSSDNHSAAPGDSKELDLGISQGEGYVGEGCKKKKLQTNGDVCNKENEDKVVTLQLLPMVHPQGKKKHKEAHAKVHFTAPGIFKFWKKKLDQPSEEFPIDSTINGAENSNDVHVDSRNAKQQPQATTSLSDTSKAKLPDSLKLPKPMHDYGKHMSKNLFVKYDLMSECITAPPNLESVQVKCATDVADRVDNLSALVGSLNGAVGPPVFGDSPPEDHEGLLSPRINRSPAYTIFLPPSAIYSDCPANVVTSNSSHASESTCASDMPLLPKDMYLSPTATLAKHLSAEEDKQEGPLLAGQPRLRRSSSMDISHIPRPGNLYLPQSHGGVSSQTSQEANSNSQSGSSRHVAMEDDERLDMIGIGLTATQTINEERTGSQDGSTPPHIFSLKYLCADRSTNPQPQGMPPDYVKIAIILLLPALPCALPALIWALKSRQQCRLGEYSRAWQYSYRAFFCCFTGLVGFAMLLLAFMVLMYVRNYNCVTSIQPIIVTIAPMQLDPTRTVLPPKGIGSHHEIMGLAQDQQDKQDHNQSQEEQPTRTQKATRRPQPTGRQQPPRQHQQKQKGLGPPNFPSQ